MKLRLLTLFLLISLLSAEAQTNFRDLSFSEACQVAKEENKKVFVDFYTSWCSPCMRLAKLVFPTKEIGDYLNSHFVCIKVDAEKEGKELAQRSYVSSYPTLAVYDTDGKMTGSVVGFKEGQTLIEAIDCIANLEMTPEIIEKRYNEGKWSPDIIMAYVNLVIKDRGHDFDKAQKEADRIVNEYYDSLSDSQRLLADNKFIYLYYTKNYSNPRREFIRNHFNDFDSSIREDLGAVLKNIYLGEAIRYFTGNHLKDSQSEAAFSKFIKEAEELGYIDDLKNRIYFIMNRAAMQDDEYLNFCYENILSLNEIEISEFLSNITEIFAVESPEQKLKVSSFVRDKIGKLSVNNLYAAMLAIMKLETTEG